MSLKAFLSPSILSSLSLRAGLTWGSSRRWNLLLEFLSFCNNSNNLPAFAAQTFDVCYLTTQGKNESELWPVFLAFWCSGRRCVWRRTRNFMAPEHRNLRTANTDGQENDRLIFLSLFNVKENYVPQFWKILEAKFQVQSAFSQKKNIASIDGQEREFLGTRQTIYGHTEKLLWGFRFWTPISQVQSHSISHKNHKMLGILWVQQKRN